MNELFSIGIFPVVLSLGAYQLGLAIQKKWKLAILNPLLLSALLVMAVWLAGGEEMHVYTQSMQSLSWLMTPATICLAIPMYEQLQVLKKNWKAILAGVAAGALGCVVFLALMGAALGFERVLTLSLLPKSVTTAVGVPLSEILGGAPSITALCIALTGLCGNVLGPTLCRVFKITEPVAQGVAFGTASHVLGTPKAAEMSQLAGAVSSLSLVVAGILTAVILPTAVSFF